MESLTVQLLTPSLVRLLAVAEASIPQRWRFEGGRAAVYPRERSTVLVVVHRTFALAAERLPDGELRIEHAIGRPSCARPWLEALADTLGRRPHRVRVC